MKMQTVMRHSWIVFGPPVLLANAMLASRAMASPSFQGLGDLPGGSFESIARYITPDGRTVLGGSATGFSGLSKFIWTETGGMQALSHFPSGDFSSGSSGLITNDQSVIVGTGQSSLGTEAFRWTPVGGASGLGDLPGGVFRSQPSAMSADGSVIVGKGTIGPDTFSDTEAFVWSAANGLVGLGDLPGGPDWSWATDVSADGTVVVGIGTVVTSPGEPWESFDFRAFRWTDSEGMTDLGIPSGDWQSFRESRISSDGSVIVVNTANLLGETQPFRWTESTGFVPLDDPIGATDLAQVVDLSADGTVIAGWAFGRGGPQAVVWDDLHGPRYLADILTDLGLDLTGWSLEFTTGISDDGLTIVGTGINPDGNTEAFIARLPEPGAAGVFGLGVTALLRRRRVGDC